MIWYDETAARREERFAIWDKRVEQDGTPQAIPQKYARELQSKIAGKVVLPGDPDYNTDRMVFNPRFSAYPQAIVYCVSPADVAECLNVSRALDLPVVVRSGGHSTAGFSSQSGFLIDVSELNDVGIYPESECAWVGPGTTFGKFNKHLQAYGYHTPGGACPTVCVGGYMQGGGYGFTARIFGMNCDQVEAVRVMLSDGRIVYADSEWNTDLYWAVRGGTGSNFGVLLAVKYKIYPLNSFAGFSICWSMAGAEGETQTANALAWLQANFMRTGAPDQLGYQMIWAYQGAEGTAKEPMLLMRGMYNGSTEDMRSVIQPVLDQPGAVLQTVYDPMPYEALNEALLSKPYEIPEFPKNFPFPPREAKLSRYLDQLLTADDWLKLVQYYVSTPNQTAIAAMEIYGGAIATPERTNAFIHRDVYCDIFFDVFWATEADKDQMLAFSQGWADTIAPYWGGRVYQNYPSPDNPDFGENYWGSYYPVLRFIKSKYDPLNLFRYPQSIAPTDRLDEDMGVNGLDKPIQHAHRS